MCLCWAYRFIGHLWTGSEDREIRVVAGGTETYRVEGRGGAGTERTLDDKKSFNSTSHVARSGTPRGRLEKDATKKLLLIWWTSDARMRGRRNDTIPGL